MTVDLVRAMTAQLLSESQQIRTLDNYYTGNQPLGFLHPQVRAATSGRLSNLVVNWPRVIIGAIEERLDVEGFRLAGDENPIPDLWRIWQANDLDEWSQLGHTDALVHGVCYALVWAGERPETPRITMETAREMTVTYAPGTARVTAALKTWAGQGMSFATLYLPDRVEKYESRGNVVDGLAADWRLVETIPHDLGVVPVVPFINRPRLGVSGESEMSDVLPLADALNKLCTDMMVSAEYHAMPRRWATGMQIESGAGGVERTAEIAKQRWTQAEAGRVWMTDSAEAKFGQFAEANLSNFVQAVGMITGQIAAMAGIPPHYLGVNSENPASADAIRSAESSLVKKAKRKQRGFGGSWERVMRLAQLVRDGVADPELDMLEVIWRDPETPTVAQKADAAVKLKQAGIITDEQALEDLGYTPVQIERERARRADTALGPVRAQLDEAQRLMREDNLSQPAAYAAVGLLQAAQQMNNTTP